MVEMPAEHVGIERLRILLADAGIEPGDMSDAEVLAAYKERFGDNVTVNGAQELKEEVAGVDEETFLYKKGVIDFETLANIVNDYLSKAVPNVINCAVELNWLVEENGISCSYEIFKSKADDLPANADPENVKIAQEVLNKFPPEVIEQVKAQVPGVLNTVVGHVMKALYEQKQEVVPEKAFELVVNLLELSFEQPKEP